VKHSAECVNIPLRELAAIATALGIPIPQSVTDITSRMPPVLPAKPAPATVLQAAITATQTTITIVPAVPTIRAGDVIRIGSENLYVTGVNPPSAPLSLFQSLSVIRGFAGTTAAAAASGPVTFAPQTADLRAKALINTALLMRADMRVASGAPPFLSTPYQWPFSPKPPNFTNAPQQIAGGQMINQVSAQGGVVVPPAPGGGNPDPAPPPSGSPQPWTDETPEPKVEHKPEPRPEPRRGRYR
jgi:hypothetical protein